METSLRSAQWFQAEPGVKLSQHASSVLLSGSMFNFSLSTSTCVSFPSPCLQTSVNDKKSSKIVSSRSVKDAIVTALLYGKQNESFLTTRLDH